ncbi:M15 family metallopeptidase [Glutamicibacter halophytocola]|uniref:M15 family metallopeptidase n=1 Tax=Glutamicibacter halophytocola TaxID=1933880 RepID=A0AA95BR52_9MICC|nr:M15 family metallopeptidase [Glutamicibacter halophytocola]NQD41043.1 M15 family metallopeptidase [Glutamicibacter halophytocola]UUX58152.1 M15 family metallopeptidase [Glutamicibacter halophytocola]
MRKTRVMISTVLIAIAALFLGSCAALTTSTSATADLGAKAVKTIFTASEDDELRESQVSPFDDSHRAISNLDPQLREALQEAAAAAKEQGIKDFWVTSGWRSRGYQQELLDQAIAKYGSEAEASKWVASPDDSSHVTGNAVDVGPTVAADWLSRKGQRFGLCQRYANELWHYELAADPQGQCPAMRPSAAS